MKNAGRIRAALQSGSDGQAMLEFVLVFPVVLLLVMGIIEFSLLTNAHQMVDLSAFHTARSAAVGGNYRMATAISCIPTSPSAVGGIDPGTIPGLAQIAQLLDDIIGIPHAVEKATFGYFLTLVGSDITYYDSHDKKVSKVSDASYLQSKIVYCYPLKFPVISAIAAMVSRRATDKIPIIGDIFYVNDSDYLKYWAVCEGYSALSGLKFIPIIKTCTMGLN